MIRTAGCSSRELPPRNLGDPTSALWQAVADATARLAEAGVNSPRVDAEELAAHAAGTERGRLPLLDAPGPEFFDRFAELVSARARRVPLQHLVGTAAFGPVHLEVGPGVFIPRPETEALLEWAMAQALPPDPVILDLCTGSGALAVALAAALPTARVIAVDNAPSALDYARRNATGSGVELVRGDVRDPALLHDFDGRVDLIVSNPPYLPDAAVLEPEVAQHDPPEALFGGPDGNDIIAAIAPLAARLLRPGGLVAVEHDDTASPAVAQIFVDTACFEAVTPHTDFAHRPRFVTARRRGTS